MHVWMWGWVGMGVCTYKGVAELMEWGVTFVCAEFYGETLAWPADP